MDVIFPPIPQALALSASAAVLPCGTQAASGVIASQSDMTSVTNVIAGVGTGLATSFAALAVDDRFVTSRPARKGVTLANLKVAVCATPPPAAAIAAGSRKRQRQDSVDTATE
jgi:hypothetical protein